MNHNDIRHMLSEYIDGAITSEDRAAIEEHLTTCVKCREALKELRQTVAHIRSVEELDPPAWMTQKIMAKVRAEAEKKSWFQRFFFPLYIKLPLEAVGVLFIAVTAVFIYQNMQSAMKREYEKPAQPALQNQAAAPAPMVPTKEKQTYPADGESALPLLKKEEAGIGRTQGRAMTSPDASPEAAGKAKSIAPVAPFAGAVSADKAFPSIILQVMDLEEAAVNVEKAIARVNGTIVRREAPGSKMIFFVTIKARRTGELQNKLKLFGDLKELPGDGVFQQEQVKLRIELVRKPAPH